MQCPDCSEDEIVRIRRYPSGRYIMVVHLADWELMKDMRPTLTSTFHRRAGYTKVPVSYAGLGIYEPSRKHVHVFLLPGKIVVDHINEDTLDNRRCNLRDGYAKDSRGKSLQSSREGRREPIPWQEWSDKRIRTIDIRKGGIIL